MRFVCAVVALSALTFGYLSLQHGGDWLFGFYAIEAALAVAVVAAGLRLLAEISYRHATGG
jgi:hypothetical protein